MSVMDLTNMIKKQIKAIKNNILTPDTTLSFVKILNKLIKITIPERTILNNRDFKLFFFKLSCAPFKTI